MGLFDKLRSELVDIIEWVDDSRHTLVGVSLDIKTKSKMEPS